MAKPVAGSEMTFVVQRKTTITKINMTPVRFDLEPGDYTVISVAAPMQDARIPNVTVEWFEI